MKPVEETRRIRLQMLIKQHGSQSGLTKAIGIDGFTDAKISRIVNQHKRHDREGAPPYVLGSDLARKIETALQLPEGWMDTPPSYADLNEEDARAKVLKIMEQMPQDQWATAVRLLDALAQPPTTRATGTDGKY